MPSSATGPTAPSEEPVPTIRIEATTGFSLSKVRELWSYRELIFFFVWRDLKVRYKQTVLGASWAVIQPLVTMAIFTIFLGRMAKVPSDGLPYPIFAFAGLVPWTFFSTALNQASGSLLANVNMLKKIYFPRLALPIGTILAALVDLCFAFGMLIILMVIYGFPPTWSSLWIPLFIFLAFITCLGASLWLSAMNVQFRDVRYTLPFIVQIWFFATPIVYPSSMLSENWRILYGLNPLVSVVEGFRWALLGVNDPPGLMLAVSFLSALILVASGLFYFVRTDRTFADIA